MSEVKSLEPPDHSVTVTPAERAASPAAASIVGSGSAAVTRIPALANDRARRPGPVPRSNTGSPARSPVSAITRSMSRAG